MDNYVHLQNCQNSRTTRKASMGSPLLRVVEPGRKFHISKSVDSFEHSEQCEWNGRFLVTSQANLILNESIAILSSRTWRTSWPESKAPELFSGVP